MTSNAITNDPKKSVTITTAGGDASLDKTFSVVNQMVLEGVIESYALGGAMAAVFYIEPIATFDVDIFCFINGIANELDPLRPIYDYLRSKATPEYAEGFIIAGLRVQFLPVFNPLNDEAVQTANTFSLNDVIIRVMAPEYLVANMLETGRKKDHTRIAQFFEADICNTDKLHDILSRHKLQAKMEALQNTWDVK
jgi:hypothetical protein